MLSLASRFTVNPILLPVENDPFRSQLRSYIGLHSPLDLQFHQKAAVLTTDASRKNFCLRHLAVVAKSATNAQVTMSRNLNFSETTQCLTINPKVSFYLKVLCWKSWKFWCQNVKVDKDRKEKKVGKTESSSVQFCTFASLLLTLVLHWFVSGFFSCQSITRRVKLVLPSSTTLLALLHTHCTGLRTNEKCCLSFFPFLASRTRKYAWLSARNSDGICRLRPLIFQTPDTWLNWHSDTDWIKSERSEHILSPQPKNWFECKRLFWIDSIYNCLHSRTFWCCQIAIFKSFINKYYESWANAKTCPETL